MLQRSDREWGPVLDYFAKLGIDVGLLVPTETGMGKGILDATEIVRAALKSAGFHDYSLQGQGRDNKRVVDAVVLGASGTSETKISLYRPETKSGDPRIWIYGLQKYACPGNLLALFVDGEKLVVLNTSDKSIWRQLESGQGPCSDYLKRISSRLTATEQELLEKLHQIADFGWHKNIGAGPKAVGETLESLLGLSANSSKEPDFKGIELKAKRRIAGRRPTGLQTIFSQVPDWEKSPIGRAKNFFLIEDIIDANKNGRRQLYCTISATSPNTKSLLLDLENELNDLWCVRDVASGRDKLLFWDVDALRESLRKKHRTTMWVAADHRGKGHSEEFRYHQATLTRAPLDSQLGLRLDDGTVTLDLTLSEKPNGAVRDHGYLFRVAPVNLDRLFPSPKVFELGGFLVS
jgi:hypothetical protein